MAFDPDAYLASSSGGFNPDAYLASGNNQPTRSSYTMGGLASNILPDIGRNVMGVASQLKQGLYDVPKAVGSFPAQLAQGIAKGQPLSQTVNQSNLANFTNQNVQGMEQGIESLAQDPVGAIYRNPFTTALSVAALGSKVPQVANWAGIKGMSAALGPSEEAITARLQNPQAISGAASYADLAQQLPDTLNTLKDQISQHAENAYSTLRDSPDPKQGAIPKSQLVDIWGDLMKKLQVDDTLVGPAKKAASDKLTSIVDDALNVSKGQPTLSESNVKGVLQSIDPNIDWTDKSSTASNSILTDFRGQLDQLLKSKNADYAQAMQPVSDKIGLLQSLQKAFSITNRTGEGLQPTDATISKLQSLPSERKSITQGLAGELAQATGEDYTQKSKNYGYAKQFQGGTTQGSRRVNLGALVGGPVGAGVGYLTGSPATGALIGEGIGAGAGALADKYGGQMAAGLIDRYSPIYNNINNLASSGQAQAARQAAIMALINQKYGNQQGGQ